MSTEREPRPSSLRRYLAVVRRRRWVILGIVVIGVASAIALSLTQKTQYTAESALRFKDLSESLGQVGLLPTQGEFPAQTSAQGAESVTQDDVLNAVIKKLNLKTDADSLAGDVSAVQDPSSNLVRISASASTAAGSARLANAVSKEAVKILNRQARAPFRRYSKRLVEQAQAIDVPSSNVLNASNQQRSEIDEAAKRRDKLTELASQYQALATVAEVAEVAKTATVPTSASTTSPVKAGIIGGVLGLIIALIATAILESLDRRVHTADEAQSLLGSPMIGAVLEDNLGGMPLADKPGEDQVAAMNSFRILRTNLNFLQVDETPKTVLVTSALAEEGKTTVAIGMALAAAGRGKALLVEADLHRPVHAKRLGLKQQPGLSDYLAGEASPHDVVQVFKFNDPAQGIVTNGDHRERLSLTCITAGSPTPWATELIGSQRFTDFLQKVRQVYDLVVIDSAPLLGVAETSDLVSLADAVAVCVRLNRTTAEQVRAGRSALDRLPEKPTGIVVTGVTASDPSYYTYAYSYGAERIGAAS
jgi:capsular exopolysaccharide synthesis family protein